MLIFLFVYVNTLSKIFRINSYSNLFAFAYIHVIKSDLYNLTRSTGAQRVAGIRHPDTQIEVLLLLLYLEKVRSGKSSVQASEKPQSKLIHYIMVFLTRETDHYIMVPN